MEAKVLKRIGPDNYERIIWLPITFKVIPRIGECFSLSNSNDYYKVINVIYKDIDKNHAMAYIVVEPTELYF